MHVCDRVSLPPPQRSLRRLPRSNDRGSFVFVRLRLCGIHVKMRLKVVSIALPDTFFKVYLLIFSSRLCYDSRMKQSKSAL
jgi:hypothetical protein